MELNLAKLWSSSGSAYMQEQWYWKAIKNVNNKYHEAWEIYDGISFCSFMKHWYTVICIKHTSFSDSMFISSTATLPICYLNDSINIKRLCFGVCYRPENDSCCQKRRGLWEKLYRTVHSACYSAQHPCRKSTGQFNFCCFKRSKFSSFNRHTCMFLHKLNKAEHSLRHKFCKVFLTCFQVDITWPEQFHTSGPQVWTSRQ